MSAELLGTVRASSWPTLSVIDGDKAASTPTKRKDRKE